MSKNLQVAFLSSLVAFVVGFGSGYLVRPYVDGGGMAVPAQPGPPPMIDPAGLEPLRPSGIPSERDEAATDPAGDAPETDDSSEPSRPPGVPPEGAGGQPDPVELPPR